MRRVPCYAAAVRAKAIAVLLMLPLLMPACRRGGSGGAGDARALFLATCAKCHGPSGHADTPQGRLVGAKDLTRDEARRMTDAQIVEQIRKGKGRMPAFGDVLGAAEIAGLVAEVRKLQQ